MAARGRMLPLQLLLLALISATSSQAFVVGDGARSCIASVGATNVPPSLASSCNNAPHHSYRHLPTSPGHHRGQSSSSSTAFASTSWCWSTDSRIYEGEGFVTTSGDDVSSPSPRLWMEDIEQTEGCGGAYTVMRCEIVENVGSTDLNEDRYIWKTWDFDFHLKRLRTSYEIKYAQEEGDSSREGACSEADYLTAELESNLSIAKMLDEVKSEMEFKTLRAILVDAGTIPVLMVTILWTKKTKDGSKNNGEEQSPIRVRAHGSIANVPSPESGKLPAAIWASVALPPFVAGSSYQRDWSSLTNRHKHDPDAKDSSWCRERRPLEDMFKADGIGEVLLARAADADGAGEFHGIELLEGLTSNLFVVCRDGTLRTAAAEGNVLKGCARHHVLEAAERVGLSYDETKPVLLQDAIDGLWSEVFVTSAIRLVVPVTTLSVPEYEKDEENEAKILSFRKIWDATNSSVDSASTDEQGEVDTTVWATLAVEELKDELRRRGLKVGGRKAELIQRLHYDEHYNSSEQGWTGKLYRQVILSYKDISLASQQSFFERELVLLSKVSRLF